METAILFGFAVFGGGLLGYFVGRATKTIDIAEAYYKGRRDQIAARASIDQDLARLKTAKS